MEAYLDNAATTKPLASVVRLMEETMETAYGNPSSLHKKGFEAEEYIEEARKQIAKTLRAEPGEIVFTSGGTESNNQAIFGTALAAKRRGKHLITTSIEHASIYQPMGFLEEMGYEVTYLPVDEYGHVLEEALKAAIRPDTILVSLQYVNNEVGSVQDIAALSALVKQANPDTLLHVDAIQAYGKLPICPKREGIDLLSASGHKIHGPKGSGILYIRNGVRIQPLLYGGEQQKNRRSGTENVPAIAGMGQAAWELGQTLSERKERLYQLKEYFITNLQNVLSDCVIHALPKPLETVKTAAGQQAIRYTAPHIVSVGFEGVKSEVLLLALEDREIYVSSGSACSSNHPGISGTLQAIGAERRYWDSTLRFSFGAFTTEAELDAAVAALAELVPTLRRYVRK